MKTKADPKDSTTNLESEVSGALENEELGGTQRIEKLTKPQILKLARAIVAFSEHLCGCSLYPYQRDFCFRIAVSVLESDAEEITALFSRQSGKSQAVAVIVLGMMVMLPLLAQLQVDPADANSAKVFADPRIQKYAKGFWVGVYAPSHEQADIVYTRMLSLIKSPQATAVLADDEIGISLEDKGSKLELPNGSKAVAYSAAPQAKIEGRTWHFILMDEAQDLNPYVYKKSISPMGASTAATQVKIGTCNTVRSDFYDACNRNALKDSRSGGKLETRLHFQNDYEVAGKHNPWYAAYVKKEVEKIGYDSDEFRMSYRLHWILERGMFVDPLQFSNLGKDYSLITYDPTSPIVIGIDVGKSESATVATAIRPDTKKGVALGPDDFRTFKRILNWMECKGDDYLNHLAQLSEFIRNYRNTVKIVVDSTGVGAMMADLLQDQFRDAIERGELELVRFIATADSNNEGYLRLLNDLQNDRLEYPNSERARKNPRQREFVQQVLNLQKVYRGAYLAVEAGDSGLYKDYCSSLMLAAYGCDVQAEESVEIEEEPNFVLGDGGLGRHNLRNGGLARLRGVPFYRGI